MSNCKDEMDKTIYQFFDKLNDMLEYDKGIEVNSVDELKQKVENYNTN